MHWYNGTNPALHRDTGSASQSGRRTLWGEQFQGTVTTPHLRAHWQQNLMKWPAVIVSKRSFLTSVSPICCPSLVWSTMTPVFNGPPMRGVRKGRTWMKTVNQLITKRCRLHRRKQNNHLIAFHPANNALLQTAMTTGTCIPAGESFYAIHTITMRPNANGRTTPDGTVQQTSTFEIHVYNDWR